jgi:hypothetical protein
MFQKSIILILTITAMGGFQEVNAATTFVLPTITQDTLSKQQIFSSVQKITAELLGIDKNKITLKSTFTNDLGADSLDFVELIMDMEK